MPLTARSLRRKMRGGAQAHLIEADNGSFYVVKFLENPQHRRILVNELIASVILRYLQIACPEFALIKITPEFLKANPEVYMQLGTKHMPVEPGWHYGSMHPGHPDTMAVYDFMPDALLAKVQNRTDFLAALVFDKWTANSDGRQSIFFRAYLNEWFPASSIHPRKMGFVALMIDNGFILNGQNWDFPESPIMGLYGRRIVYEDVHSMDDFQPWLDRVVHFPDTVLDRALRQIPPEWLDGDEPQIEQTLEKLLRRCKRVPDLINDTREAKTNPFPNWK